MSERDRHWLTAVALTLIVLTGISVLAQPPSVKHIKAFDFEEFSSPPVACDSSTIGYSYISDGSDLLLCNGSEWRILMQRRANGSLLLPPLASAPASPDVGDMYVDSSGALCVCVVDDLWTNLTPLSGGTCS